MKRIEIMVLVIAIFIADNLANHGYYLFFTHDLYPIGYALLGAVVADTLDGRKQVLHSRRIPVLLFAVYLLCSVGTCFMTVQASSQAGFLVETYLIYNNPFILAAAVSLFLSIGLSRFDFVDTHMQKKMTDLSSITYGVYLIHPAVIDLMINQLPKFLSSLNPDFKSFLSTTSDLVFIILGGTIIYTVSAFIICIGKTLIRKLGHSA